MVEKKGLFKTLPERIVVMENQNLLSHSESGFMINTDKII